MKKLPPSKRARLDDAALKALLKGLREDVAAPPDFRARVLARLRRDGLLKDGPALAARPGLGGLLAGLAARISPAPGWGLALGGALALALVALFAFPRLDGNLVQAPSAGAPGAQALPSSPAPSAGAVVASASRSSAPALAARPAQGSQPFRRRQASPDRPALAGAAGPARPSQGQSLAKVEGSAQPGGGSSLQPVVAEKAEGLGSSVNQLPAVSNKVSGSDALQTDGGAAVHAADLGGGTKPTEVVATPTPLSQPLAHNSEVRNNVVRVARGDSAQILFTVAQGGPVVVEVFNRLGRLVATLQNGALGPGQYSLSWNGAADDGGVAASGIYLVLVQTTTYVDKHKLALVK